MNFIISFSKPVHYRFLILTGVADAYNEAKDKDKEVQKEERDKEQKKVAALIQGDLPMAFKVLVNAENNAGEEVEPLLENIVVGDGPGLLADLVRYWPPDHGAYNCNS